MNDLVTTAVDEETGEVVAITEELRLEARQIHEDIVIHGTRSLQSLKALAASLKEMRNKRLFLALGHHSFDEYCRKEIGFSRDWADAQIQSAVILDDFADPGRQIPSSTHLRLLARLSSENRKSFLETHAPTDMTKRELEAKIREINSAKRQNEALAQRLAAAEDKAKVETIRAETERKAREVAEQKTMEAISKQPAPVVVPDERALTKIRQQSERIAFLEAEQQKPEYAKDQLQKLQDELATLRVVRDKTLALQEEAFRVNRSISAIVDVLTKQRGVIEVSVGKQFAEGDLESGTIQDLIGVMETISRDLRRIVRDSIPSIIEI